MSLLVKCPTCDRKISSEARVRPHCGEPNAGKEGLEYYRRAEEVSNTLAREKAQAAKQAAERFATAKARSYRRAALMSMAAILTIMTSFAISGIPAAPVRHLVKLALVAALFVPVLMFVWVFVAAAYHDNAHYLKGGPRDPTTGRDLFDSLDLPAYWFGISYIAVSIIYLIWRLNGWAVPQMIPQLFGP